MSALCSTRATDCRPFGRELLDWQNEFNTGVNIDLASAGNGEETMIGCGWRP